MIERLMTVVEAAGRLGVHPETVRRAARAGKLSHYKLQGCIRISPEQLSDYLVANLCPAREQLAVGKAYPDGLPLAVTDFQFRRRLNRALKGRSKS